MIGIGFTMSRKHLQLSNKNMTIKVETDAANNIRRAAPIAKRFIGQPLINLIHWLEKQGKTDVFQLRKGDK
jgi:hypothetical protein